MTRLEQYSCLKTSESYHIPKEFSEECEAEIHLSGGDDSFKIVFSSCAIERGTKELIGLAKETELLFVPSWLRCFEKQEIEAFIEE